MAFRPGFRALTLEPLDDRSLPSVTFVEADGILTIKGDQSANTIRVFDDGSINAGGIVVVADGVTYPSQGEITKIVIAGRGGADTVEYQLFGPLSSERNVIARLGNGNDTFLASLSGSLFDTAKLNIKVDGGNGNDQLILEAASVDVGLDASLTVNFLGDNGRDTLRTDYSGVLMGTASILSRGGNGKDSLSGNIALKSYGSSELNESYPSTGSLSVEFKGGNGVDDLSLQVTGANDLSSPLVASLNGGHGKDTFTASDNVTIVDPVKTKKK